MMLAHKQMFWNTKTLEKWKLSTWEKKTRQSNKTLVNLISIHGMRESDGLTQRVSTEGSMAFPAQKVPGKLGHQNSSMRLVGIAQLHGI